MAQRHDIHVVPNDGNWLVRRENQNEPLSSHSTQAEAEEAGRAIAKEDQVELHVHGQDGQVRDRSSYGNDPRNIPG